MKNKDTNRYHFDEPKHVHSLDGKPLDGTSSVCGIVYKPLSWWASGKAVEIFGWVHKRERIQTRLEASNAVLKKIKKMGDREYLDLIDKAYGNHNVFLDTSAQKGTDLHAELETWAKGQMTGKKKEPINQILRFVNWCRENVDEFLWTELHVYSEKNWTGGICDLGVLMKDGRIGLIDHKSSKETYYTHFLQDGGYVLQVEENKGGFDKDGNRIFELEKPIDFIGVVPYGGDDNTPVIKDNVKDFKDEFKSALKLYRGNKRFNKQKKPKSTY